MAKTTSLDYALASRNATVAVNCITYLDKGSTDNKARRDQLFKIFERDSDLFIEGFIADKITKEDIYKKMPDVWRDAFKDAKDKGFIKGYVFGSLNQYAVDMAPSPEYKGDLELMRRQQEIEFDKLYRQENCDLIK